MNRLFVPLIALLTLCQANAAAPPPPRLLLLLSVEELRADLLEELTPHLPEGGIKRLLKEGQIYSHVVSPLHLPDAVASTALIHTGTTAIGSSIPSRNPVIRTSNGRLSAAYSVFKDEEYMGFATREHLSPRRMSAATLGDKLKQASRRLSKVYSVAPKAEEAIVAGGKMANGVYWIDDFNAKWVSSTYYKEGYPWYIDRLNNPADGFSKRMTQAIWTPLHTSTLQAKYGILPYHTLGGNTPSFRHTFSPNGEGVKKYKSSGLINEEVVRVAEQLLAHGDLGKDLIPDLLSLHLYAGNHLKATQDITTELLDTYYRLDLAIAQLYKLIETHVGLANTMIALVGSGQAREYFAPDEVTGFFHRDRCKALMNMYLMAQYGQHSWVEEVSEDGQIFLDRKGIEQRKVSLEAIQRSAADFLLEFSGVQYAITDHHLRQLAVGGGGQSREFLSSLNRAINKERGDVVFSLLPGWAFTHEGDNTSGGVYKQSTVPTLFVLRAPQLPATRISTPLDLREVSRLISFSLRIRPPNNGD